MLELDLVSQGPVAEGRSLEELEAVIERGLGTFIEVGSALLEVRNRKLYLQRGFDTFEAYCTRLELSRPRAYQLCDAAEINITLSTFVDNGSPLPVREGHTRALLPLREEPEKLAAAWRKAVVTASGGKRLTAEHISAVVEEYLKPPPKYYTLPEWQAMGESDRVVALSRRHPPHTFNGQQNDNIEWAQWSWNPVTGCKHDCSYCYARDIATKSYAQGFLPSVWPSRFEDPRHTKVPEKADRDVAFKNVFTCSMADLFGRWVPAEWIEAVLEQVRANAQWNFLFLTKFPVRLREFEFPDNAWVGTTVDAQARVANAERAFADVRARVKWLSCEPLLEPLRFRRLNLFNWMVIGGASASTETPEWRPPRAWMLDLERQAADAGIKDIYEKTNLIERRREYPGQPLKERLSVPEAFKMPYLQRDVLEPEAYAAEVAG